MVSRIRRTPTVEERAAAFERTDKVAQMAAEEERLLREEKSAKLRALRLASSHGASAGYRTQVEEPIIPVRINGDKSGAIAWTTRRKAKMLQ